MKLISFEQIIHNITRRAGLQAERVTPYVIPNTAIARRVALGDDLPTPQRFMGYHLKAKAYRLRRRIVSQPQDVLWEAGAAAGAGGEGLGFGD